MVERPSVSDRSRRSPRTGRPHCAENDCALTQAEAMKAQAQASDRIAAVGEALLAEWQEVKPHIEAIGEIAGKWLRFCAFTRKWFPRVGWWLLPIVVTLLSKGTGAALDALVLALQALPGAVA